MHQNVQSNSDAILSIGIGKEPGPAPSAGAHVIALGFDGLSAAGLRQLAPAEVWSWLFCDSYDAYDVGALLREAGFAGRYRICAADLPNARGIARELGRAFPGIAISLDGSARLMPGAAAYQALVADATAAAAPERKLATA